MKKRFNRAFTITELVIVIAVVAILAAVLIPTFANIINKSNQSADTQNLKSMNTVLSAKQTIDGKPTTMQEAVEIILANGYVFEKLIASSEGYDIVWDQENNRLAMLSGDEVIYSEGEVSKDKSKLWLVVDEQIETEYSVYLSEKFDADVFNAKAGVDVGSNSDINVNITTEANNDFIVRTNGGNVVVNTPNANVAHYGIAKAVDITAVAKNSYHEYGTVEGNISIEQGRFVAEQGSQAAALVVKAESTDNVKIELSDKAEVLNIAATNSDVASNLGSIVSGATENVTIEEEVFNEESIGLFAGGLGTETSPYLISSDIEFENIINGTVDKIVYYVLTSDIDFSIQKKDKQAVLPEVVNYINLNGNNYNVIYNTHDSSMFIFENIKNSTISDINFYHNAWNTLVDNAENMLYENLNFYGEMIPGYQGFGMLGYNVSGDIVIKNCNNFAEIKAVVGYTSVFIGRVADPANIIIENSNNYANCYASAISMFVGNPNANYSLNINNCNNYGLLTSTNPLSTWSEIVTNLNGSLTCLNVNGDNWIENSTKNQENYNDNYFGNCITKVDNNLAAVINDDNTITITKAANTDVAYYRIIVDKYFNWENKDKTDTGTQRVEVSTVVNASEFVDNKFTSIDFKLYEFTTNSSFTETGIFVDGNANVDISIVEDSVAIVTDGNKYYYYINPYLENKTLSITNGLYNNCFVQAYDINGNLLYSVECK